jgi:hypothetical protein
MIVIFLIKSQEGTGIWLSGFNDILAFDSFEKAEEMLNVAIGVYQDVTSVAYIADALSKMEIRALEVPSIDWVKDYLADESLRKHTVAALAPLSAGKIRENGVQYWDVAERVPIHTD